MELTMNVVRNLVDYINTFRGCSVDELSKKTNFDTHAKNRNALLIQRIEEAYVGKRTLQNLIEIFDLSTKTIQISDGKVKESMSFPKFDYNAIIQEQWETSTLRKDFSSLFIFCVFEKKSEANVFKGAFLWRMPENDLEVEVRKVWEKTREVILSGDVVKKQSKRISCNFPKEDDNSVCHVRPHGRSASDTTELPIRDNLTSFVGLPKQSFWINRKYLMKVICEHDFMLD